MLHDLVHIHHQHDLMTHRIRIEKRRVDDDRAGREIRFNQPDYLPEQGKLRRFILPGGLHPLVFLRRNIEDDSLQPQFPLQFLQIDIREFHQIGLAVNDGGKLGTDACLRRIQHEHVHFVNID